MRFMVMHKVDAKMEAGGPPEARIIQSMGALVQEGLKNGVFITGAGLHRSAQRVRVKNAAGAVTVSPGPYAGANELLESWVMIKVPSMKEAVIHASALALASGENELEVGPVVEPWDLGLMPQPPGDVPLQVLLLGKANAQSERGQESPEQRKAALSKLSESMGDKGALLASGTLAPSAKGVRLTNPGTSKRAWVDGPFAESKELIAGFSVIDVPTLQDAITWADRYATILVGAEVDIREVVEG